MSDITPPPEAEVAKGLRAAQAAAPTGVTSVDPEQLMAMIEALQGRLGALEAERAAGQPAPVVSTAESLRDLLRVHAAHYPQTDHGDVLRLADDAVDAAKNSLESGDGGILHQLADKLVRAMKKVDPGPGDHHYFRQAMGFADVHLHDAADQLKPRPDRAPAAEVTSSQPPARVIEGSVTG